MGRQDVDPAALGAAIQRAREAKEWTRYRLGRQAGMSPVYLRDIEEGNNKRPGVNIVARIAHALGMTTDQLLAEAGFRLGGGEQPATVYGLAPPGRRALLRMGETLRELQAEYAVQEPRAAFGEDLPNQPDADEPPDTPPEEE